MKAKNSLQLKKENTTKQLYQGRNKAEIRVNIIK